MEKTPLTPHKETSPQRKAQQKIDDYNCAICLCLLYEPLHTPCKHDFCSFCLTQMRDNEESFKCPLCRSKQSYESLKPNQELNALMQIKYPAECARRKEQIAPLLRAYLSQLKLRLKVGNRCETIQNANTDNRYRWTVFVALNNNDIKKYIKSVKFKLHPTFHPPDVVVSKAPFQLTRIGWGTFNIEIVVKWQTQLNKPDSNFDHYLSFDTTETATLQTIRIDASKQQKNPAEATSQ